MEKTDIPKPSVVYKWPSGLCCLLLWAPPAIIGIPRLPGNIFLLALAELGWFTLLLFLASKAVSWFDVEFNDDGARVKSLFHDRFISWRDATVYRRGLVIMIVSPSGSIKINPAAYRNVRQLNEYIGHRIKLLRT